MKRFVIVSGPIDPLAVERLVRDRSSGGIVTFRGVVRDSADDGRPVDGLHYEAHVEMAQAEFERIADEAQERFGQCIVAVYHRIGELVCGEIAVVVSVSAPHRDVAFDACRYVIDELKARAPIWKQERYAGGGAQWKQNEPAGGGA